MVITMAIDIYGDKNNGTTVTAMRTAASLIKAGNEVRVIAWVPDKIQGDIIDGVKVLRCHKVVVPVFEGLIEANGFTFGNIDEKAIADFIKGSDVVHLLLPFPLERKVMHVAQAMNIPVTNAFHLQPDSISYNIHLGKCQPINSFIYHLFYRWTFKYTRTVHTPSQNMRRLMYVHHYRNDIHAISNGVSPFFEKMDVKKPAELKDKYIIMMTGRLSGEKRQDLIIKAVGHSKYNDKIQLIFCGQGPRKKQYERLSKKYLKNPAIFKFVTQKEVRDIINYSDLYIHASDIESEAIACIEAFTCGKVPIISDSKYSATNYFALDKRCLFKAGNYLDLRDRIEYFIEHPEVVKELSVKYIEYGKKFALYDKADQLEDMMKLEISRHQEDEKQHRMFYSSAKERRKIRKAAKKAGLPKPTLYKKDVYHSKEWKEYVAKIDKN